MTCGKIKRGEAAEQQSPVIKVIQAKIKIGHKTCSIPPGEEDLRVLCKDGMERHALIYLNIKRVYESEVIELAVEM